MNTAASSLCWPFGHGTPDGMVRNRHLLAVAILLSAAHVGLADSFIRMEVAVPGTGCG